MKAFFDDIIGVGKKNSEEKSPYKRNDLHFVKMDTLYNYDVKRNPDELGPRYHIDENGIWKKNEQTVEDEAVIMCAGDLMCEPAMSEAAYFDGRYFFDYSFKYIRPVFKTADLVIANLETMVSEDLPYAHEMHRVSYRSGARYHCNAPLQYLDALRFAGFDGFVMANNHNMDGGYEGIVDTLKNVDEKGFMRTGLFRDENDERTLLVDINGIKVGFLSYTEHINRDLDVNYLTELGRKTMINRLSYDKLVNDIKSLRDRGAEFILCYVHLNGKEYAHNVDTCCIESVQMMADAGVDCVMGTHMHALQKYDIVKTKDRRQVPVIYSLGNFISSDSTGFMTRESVVYKLTLARDVSGKVYIKDENYIPCRTVEGHQKSAFTVFPVPEEYRSVKKSEFLDGVEKKIKEIVGDINEMKNRGN